MLVALEAPLGMARAEELRRRIARDDEQSVPAEWELTVAYALSCVGELRPISSNTTQPEFLFHSPESGETVLVEVTAVSDKAAHDRNPVRAFAEALGQACSQAGLVSLGAVDYQIGSIETSKGPLLAVPPKKDIQRFFASEQFLDFVRSIKANPKKTHTLQLHYNDVVSSLTFRPGNKTSSGGHRHFQGIHSLENNPFTNRLKKKIGQIKAAGQSYPAVVVFCDNNSSPMRSIMKGWNEFSAVEVINLFLNGRPKISAGPMLIQPGIRKRTSTLNGVLLLTVKSNFMEIFSAERRRWIELKYIKNDTGTRYELRNETIQMMANGFTKLPTINSDPANARVHFSYPDLFGAYKMTDRSITFSLFTLQKVLAGEIPFERFQLEHSDVIAHFHRLSNQGFAVTKITIESCPDMDDDWVRFDFDLPFPQKGFARPSRI